jgi:hypothetical protein
MMQRRGFLRFLVGGSATIATSRLAAAQGGPEVTRRDPAIGKTVSRVADAHAIC